MKKQELQEVSARYTVVQRAAFEVLDRAMSLGQLDKASKNSPEVLEILEAYQNTRIKLIEAASWYRILHSNLMLRTDEGREAVRKYAEDMEKQQKEAAEKGAGTATEPQAPADAAVPTAEPQEDAADDEGHPPCLKLL